MKNRSFLLKTDQKRETKLIAALRQRTSDRLTAEQLRELVMSIRPGCQYTVTLHTCPESFREAMVLVKSETDNDTGTVVFGQALFGSATDTGYREAEMFNAEIPACAIISKSRLENGQQQTSYQIHIYIPEAIPVRGRMYASR